MRKKKHEHTHTNGEKLLESVIASVDFHFSYDVVGRSGVFVLDVSTYMYIYINYMYISIYFRLLITYRFNKYSSMISLCLPQLHAHLIHHISVHLLLRYTFMSWKKNALILVFLFFYSIGFNWIQFHDGDPTTTTTITEPTTTKNRQCWFFHC